MKIDYDGNSVIFNFKWRKYLRIDRKRGLIEFENNSIPFSEVKGYWKNYHPKGRRLVFYAMLLTKNRLYKITPEIKDEESIEKILEVLRDIIPAEVKE